MFDKTLEALENGKSVFLTGPAGTGKSYIVNKLKEHYKSKMVVTASTGLAAMNIGGCTIHSLTGMATNNHPSQIRNVTKKDKFEENFEILATRIIVIDEISMISGEQFELLDLIFKTAHKRLLFHKSLHMSQKEIDEAENKINETPFGGTQLIFTGDLLQLPPVVPDTCYKKWFFQAETWEKLVELDLVETIKLEKIWRQDNLDFQEILNQLRIGRCTGKINKILQARNIEVPENVKPLRISSINKVVDSINQKELDKLEGQELTILGSLEWCKQLEGEQDEDIEKKKKYIMKKLFDTSLAPYELKIKKGCRLMIIENNEEEGFVNGSTGTLIKACNLLDTTKRKYERVDQDLRDYVNFINDPEYDEFQDTMINLYKGLSEGVYEIDGKKQAEALKELMVKYSRTGAGSLFDERNISLTKVLKIKLDTGRIVYVERSDKFKLISGDYYSEYNKKDIIPDLTMKQFPVRLGYAVTIHKSQGMTLDNVEIDFQRTFEEGQVYVATSRAKSLDGIYVRNFHPSMVRANIDALNFYKNN
jgi:ATP-dependent DNA helicase PIF1